MSRQTCPENCGGCLICWGPPIDPCRHLRERMDAQSDLIARASHDLEKALSDPDITSATRAALQDISDRLRAGTPEQTQYPKTPLSLSPDRA